MAWSILAKVVRLRVYKHFNNNLYTIYLYNIVALGRWILIFLYHVVYCTCVLKYNCYVAAASTEMSTTDCVASPRWCWRWWYLLVRCRVQTSRTTIAKAAAAQLLPCPQSLQLQPNTMRRPQKTNCCFLR